MLHDFQKAFKESALSNDFTKIEPFISKAEGADHLARFSIYRNTIFLSLLETLGNAFPISKKLIGPENFTVQARAFIQAYPPDLAVLSMYGDRFPSFLKIQKEVVIDVPYLADVAALEWLRQASYFSEENERLAIDVLQSIDPVKVFSASIFLHSSVRFLETSFPISHFFDQEEVTLQTLSPEVEFLMMYRNQNSERIEVEKLTSAEYLFLKEISVGNAIGDAYIRVVEIFPDLDLQTILVQNFHRNIFSRICV